MTAREVLYPNGQTEWEEDPPVRPTRKQQAAFPEVATIRKGGEKKDNPAPGTYSGGPDLQDRFRVVFAPGAEDMKAKFLEKYGTLEPKRIKAVLPFTSTSQAWEHYNEAYNAGRLIARADDNRFITRRNPLTGVYEVTNGDPHEEYKPGMKITYQRGDRTYQLPMKPTGRLKLWLPYVDMRLVWFVLKTTSFYDCQLISQHLLALEGVAQALPSNAGSVAGIPFWIYRTEHEITWNKPDGSAQRVKKWLINLEIDPGFVKTAFARMTEFALTGIDMLQLPEGLPIESDVDPEEEEEGEDPNDLSSQQKEFWGVKASAQAAAYRSEPTTAAPAQSAVPAPTASNGESGRQALPNVVAPDGKMSYETACTVKSRSTNELYKDIPTKSLAGRLVTKQKIRTADRDEMTRYEIDAIQTILSARYHNPALEPKEKAHA